MALLKASGWQPDAFHVVIPGVHTVMILFLRKKENPLMPDVKSNQETKFKKDKLNLQKVVCY